MSPPHPDLSCPKRAVTHCIPFHPSFLTVNLTAPPLLWELQLPTGHSFLTKAGSCRAKPTASLKKPKAKTIITQTYPFKDFSSLLTAAILGCYHAVMAFQSMLLCKAKARTPLASTQVPGAI